MTNILTHDVPTYVRELISMEFGSADSEDNGHSENRKSIKPEHQKQPQQTAVFGQKVQE
jgi:hypothetical protein